MMEELSIDPGLLSGFLLSATPDGLDRAERRVLRRCATARVFDEHLYNEVLRCDPELQRIPFEQIVRHRMVDLAPGPAQRYEVHRLFRDDLFQGWWSEEEGAVESTLEIPAALSALSAQLAAYYLARGESYDHLYHLIIADRPAALESIAKKLQAAEAVFDLPAYDTLVRLLESRSSQLGPELAALYTRSWLRLDTLTFWAQEYYDTESYYERAQTQSLFDDLLADPKRWILHLFAQGGMGKTMYLLSVIARRCVPAAIPCARIDFDHEPHRAAVELAPWRLLIAIAATLNRQIEGTPFHDLLRDYADSAPGTDQDAAWRQPSQNEQRRLSSEILQRFTGILRELPGDMPVVLVFDTLEVLRHDGVELTEAFTILAALHAARPSLRVILAGRYNLAEGDDPHAPRAGRIPAYLASFADQERSEYLDYFKPDEARAYLEQERNLQGDSRLEAIIRQGGGIPFKLALLADLAEDDPEITAAEIASYPAADVIYLIERIVKRIQDPGLRWLLRYGVVPNNLTYDFFAQVMLPHLQAAMRGETYWDDPDTDDLPKRVRARGYFIQDAVLADQIDVDQVWAGLQTYVSEYSWVRPETKGAPNRLRFQPEVRVPMRRLIRPKPVYWALNRDAAAYFEQLAAADPTARAHWLEEAARHALVAEPLLVPQHVSAKEARSYLEQDRGLRGDPRLDVIIRQADGSSFRLALLANLVHSQPDTTADRLLALQNVDNSSLVEQALKQIDDPTLRWVLRYGVIPTVLTRDFVIAVMMPRLQTAIQSETDRDGLVVDELRWVAAEQRSFVVGGDSSNPLVDGASVKPIDGDQLWKTLKRYAERSSWLRWVEHPSSQEPEGLVFQPEMRTLLRQLISAGPMYQTLSRDGITYFERLAATEPERGVYWLWEAIRLALYAGRADDGERLLAIGSDDVTVEAFLRAVLNPLEEQPELPLLLELRGRASYELARRTLARSARLSALEQAEVRRWLESLQADRLAQSPLIHPARIGQLRAALAYHERHLDEAVAYCHKALAAPADLDNEAAIRLIYADVLREKGHAESLNQYRVARDCAVAANDLHIAGCAALGLGDRLRSAGSYEEAVHVFKEVLASRTDLELRGQALLTLVQLLVWLGREAEAETMGQGGLAQLSSIAGPLPPTLRFWDLRVHAAIALARYMPDDAEAALRALEELTDEEIPSSQRLDWPLALGELRARVAMARLDLPQALHEWQLLITQLPSRDDPRAADYDLTLAELYLDELAEGIQADRCLKHARAALRDPEQQARYQLLAVRALAARGKLQRARSQAEELAAAATAPAWAVAAARIELAILTDDPQHFQALAQDLAAIEPPSLALRIAEQLRRCSTPADPILNRHRLWGMAQVNVPYQDQALGALRRAEVLRLAGQSSQATEALRTADVASRSNNRLGLRRWLYLAFDRAGWPTPPPEQLPEEGRAAWNRWPFLAAVMLLEHGERLRRERPEAARRCLKLVTMALGSNSLWDSRLLALDQALQDQDKPFFDAGPLLGEPAISQPTKQPPLRGPLAAQSDRPIAVGLKLRLRDDSFWHITANVGKELRLSRQVSSPWPWLHPGATITTGALMLTRELEAGWQRVARQLSDILNIDELLNSFSPNASYTLALDIDPMLACVPWELLLTNHELMPLSYEPRCRALYRLSPSPERMDDKQIGRLAEVLLLRPDLAEQELLGRGFETHTGVNMESFYWRLKLPVRAISFDRLIRSKIGNPRVVHIIGSVGERSGRAFIEIGAGMTRGLGDRSSGISDRSRMYAHELSLALSQAQTRPLVILHVPRPSSESELLHQICLRNALAEELAETSAVAAVLATGLGDASAEYDLAETLVEALAANLQLGELVWRLSKRRRLEFRWERLGMLSSEAAPFLGTALWCARPETVFRVS